MVKGLGFAGVDAPRLTAADISRFESAAKIHDRGAFAAMLQRLIEEKVAAHSDQIEELGASTTLRNGLKARAQTLRADQSWAPSDTELQRGRRLLIAKFEDPHNLPLSEFARLAHKSRQQIYKDIAAAPPRLMALSVGPRRQRLPDWQLDPLRLKLTQAVLARANNIDAWSIYFALSEPLDGLDGRSPIAAVTATNLTTVTAAVCDALGLH